MAYSRFWQFGKFAFKQIVINLQGSGCANVHFQISNVLYLYLLTYGSSLPFISPRRPDLWTPIVGTHCFLLSLCQSPWARGARHLIQIPGNLDRDAQSPADLKSSTSQGGFSQKCAVTSSHYGKNHLITLNCCPTGYVIKWYIWECWWWWWQRHNPEYQRSSRSFLHVWYR